MLQEHEPIVAGGFKQVLQIPDFPRRQILLADVAVDFFKGFRVSDGP
jgi:hypothetical protein